MSAVHPRRRTKTAREAADTLGVSPRTIRKYAAEPRDEFLARAKARRRAVIELRTQGMTLREIADHTGEAFNQIGRLLRDARRHGEMPNVDGRTRQARADLDAIRATSTEAAQPAPDPAPDRGPGR